MMLTLFASVLFIKGLKILFHLEKLKFQELFNIRHNTRMIMLVVKHFVSLPCIEEEEKIMTFCISFVGKTIYNVFLNCVYPQVSSHWRLYHHQQK